MRIAFGIGGVISKYPDIFRVMIRALTRSRDIEVFIITDMHNRAQSLEMLEMNGFGWMVNDRVYSADFETYGEACKAVLLEQLQIDVMIDDFPAYVAAGCPVRLLALPDITRPYYADDWKVPESVGDFGRRKRVAAYEARKRKD